MGRCINNYMNYLWHRLCSRIRYYRICLALAKIERQARKNLRMGISIDEHLNNLESIILYK